jgi:chromosome segregation protein
LERQASRAQDYEHAIADLRALLREWYGYHWHKTQEELSGAQEQTKGQEVSLGEARQKESELEFDVSRLREERQTSRNELSEMHLQSAELHSRRESTSRELAVAEERARYLQEQENGAREAITQLGEEIGLTEARYTYAIEEVERLESEFEEAKERGGSVEDSYNNRKSERGKIESNLIAARESLIEDSTKQSNLKIQYSERLAQLNHNQKSLDNAARALGGGKDQLQITEEKVGKSAQELQAAEDKANEISTSKKDLELKILDHHEQNRILAKRSAELETVLAKLAAQSEVIEQANRTFAGYSSGAKTLLEVINGAGILGSRLEVPERFEIAIGAALGEYLDAIVLQEQSEVDQALSLLEKTNEKAAIIPLNALLPHLSRSELLEMRNVYGWASEIIGAPDEIKSAIDLLLGNTIIVKDRQVASKLINHHQKTSLVGDNHEFQIVTLTGEVFHSHGPIRTSAMSKPASISRRREGKQIRERMNDAEGKIQDIKEQLSQAELTGSSLEEQERLLADEYQVQIQIQEEKQFAHRHKLMDLEQIKNEMQWREEQITQFGDKILEFERQINENSREMEKYSEREEQLQERIDNLIVELDKLPLDNIQTDRAHWVTRIAVLEQAYGESKERLEERKQSLDNLSNRSRVIEENIEQLQINQQGMEKTIESLQKSNLEIGEEIDSTRRLIIPREESLAAAEEKLTQLQAEASKDRIVLNQAEHNYAQARIAQVRRQEALDALRRQIEVDFGLVAFEYLEDVSGPTPLPFEGIIEELPKINDLPSGTEQALNRQRALLRRIGPVNPEAQIEYEEVGERYEFLTTQINDLQDAAVDVRKVIEELDEIMEREFCNTFEQVAVEFHQIFGRLFGGGSAKLILTDPNDLTETGIDIEARLPGRREQGLSLLSGGERSLTAVALVFALLRVSPTPFCVLDEVDAMLDEANVGRFRELLRELSESTQFIMITHNRASVQVADVIYGVTMGRDSTSRILSLKVDELEKVI